MYYLSEFQLGFENSTYSVSEEQGSIDVYIVRMNEDILQNNYIFTINVVSSEWPYPANLGMFTNFFCSYTLNYFTKIAGEDFNIEPITVKFDNNETKAHIKITVVNDVVEEGYENFILQLSYNEVSNNGAVNIVREYATVSIEDDDG